MSDPNRSDNEILDKLQDRFIGAIWDGSFPDTATCGDLMADLGRLTARYLVDRIARDSAQAFIEAHGVADE